MDRVADIELYSYLLRLAVLANSLTEEHKKRREQENALAAEQLQQTAVITFGKLPKGSLKALMSFFKQLALDKQATAVDSTLKRTYLAFYTQLLDLKSTDPAQLEELSQTTELLILKFTACVTKVAGQALVDNQGASFIQLLRSVVKKQGGSSQLDSQLASREAEFNAPKTLKRTSRAKKSSQSDTEYVSEHISKVMLVSPMLFERDLAKNSDVTLRDQAAFVKNLEVSITNGNHPVYLQSDFNNPELWNRFLEDEVAQVRELQSYFPESIPGTVPPELLPPNIKAYMSAFLERCIEFDLKEPTLFTNRTKTLIKFVCQVWRISVQGYITCLLYAIAVLLRRKTVPVSIIDDIYGYSEHILSGIEDAWPHTDRILAYKALEMMREDVTIGIVEAFGKLFTPAPPKFGPLLHALTINLPSFADILGINENEYPVILPQQLKRIEQSIIASAEAEYDKIVSRIPRDSTLSIEDIVKLVQNITNTAQKLQKKYKMPMLDKLPIAKIVCAKQLVLLSQDFEPIWKFCVNQYKLKDQEPDFETMVSLHEELLQLQDLSSQVKISPGLFNFDAEEHLFPYFEKWAIDSSALSQKWVQPAIENDTNEPLDPPSKMYSSAVKDLFSSFYASVALIDKMDWSNQFHLARLLTTIVGGISSALCQWASRIHELFMDEMIQASALPPVPSLKLKAKEQEEQWLSYAKEATAQAAAAMIARSTKPAPSFDFKRESGIKLNNIEAAYNMLQRMESQLNSDAVSKRLRDFQSKSGKPDSSSSRFLFNVTIIGASGIDYTSRGLYLTLIDHDSRKQLGKTHISTDGIRPKWNESFEFEVGNRPRLVRATLWSYGSSSDHQVCGRVMLRLDAKQYVKKEYGMQLKWIDLDGGNGKLHFMFTVDQQFDDIRFHFGKALRFIKQTQDMMVTNIVAKFSEFINSTLSRQTLQNVTGQGGIANSVQTGVSQLQKSFNSWLGKPILTSTQTSQPVNVQDLVDKSLEPLYDYLNKNFATLAGILTLELRTEVLSRTWDVVLDALESLILPPLEPVKTNQTPLNSAEMEALYMWLSRLREFFHSDGAGPSLERLQSQNYQQIMTIPVYYDLPISQLKAESDKVVRASLRAIANNTQLLARQGTVMAHRNKSVIEHQAIQLQNAQRNSPRLDDIILRILRLRGEVAFVGQQIKFQERLLQQEMTEKALQGSLF